MKIHPQSSARHVNRLGDCQKVSNRYDHSIPVEFSIFTRLIHNSKGNLLMSSLFLSTVIRYFLGNNLCRQKFGRNEHYIQLVINGPDLYAFIGFIGFIGPDDDDIN